MKMEVTGIPLILMGLMVVATGMILFLIYKADKSTTVDSFVTEITASQQGTIASQEETYKNLLVIQGYIENANEWFDKSLTDRVASLMTRKLMEEPEAAVGKVYKASIVIEFSGPVDGGNFIRHGEIVFEEGTPMLDGMIWENIN